MLLAKGKIIYFNEREKAVNYFAGIGYPCPELSNPSDFFMSMMSIESIEREDVDKSNVDALKKSSQKVLETYEEKIKHFLTEYENSALRNDPNDKHP